MNINAGETKIIKTAKYGDVKVWNWQDTEVHFEWTVRGMKETGSINIVTGAVVNVSRDLLAAVSAEL